MKNLFLGLIAFQIGCICIVLYGINQNLHTLLVNGAGIVTVLPYNDEEGSV